MGLQESVCNVALSWLWRFLHVILSVYSFCVLHLERLFFTDFVHHILRSRRGFALAKSEAGTLTRVPVHLGLVFSDDPQRCSLSNLVELITWSAGFGISFITVYDREGFWRARSNEIKLLLEKKTKHATTSALGPCSQIMSSDQTLLIPKSNGGTENNFAAFGGTKVIFLTEADGKLSMACAAKCICEEVAAGRLDASTVNQDFVDQFIRRGQSFPDPDLVIRVGRLNSLSGYLPWHVRLTEILFPPFVMESVSFRNMKKALLRFSMVEQRIGR